MTMKLKIIFNFFTITLILFSVDYPLFAGSNTAGELGAVLRLGVDAKVTSLGKAFNANEIPANAAFYNPAKLTIIGKGTFSGLLTKPYGEINDLDYNAIGVSVPLLKNNSEYPPYAFGLNALLLSADNIREAEYSGLTRNMYSSRESPIILGYG